MAEGGAAIHTVRERFSPLHHRPPRCWEPADPTGAAGRERVGFRKSTSVATVIFAQCKSPRSLLRETAPQQHLKKSALWLRTALPHAHLQTHRGLQGTETFITRTQKVQINGAGTEAACSKQEDSLSSLSLVIPLCSDHVWLRAPLCRDTAKPQPRVHHVCSCTRTASNVQTSNTSLSFSTWTDSLCFELGSCRLCWAEVLPTCLKSSLWAKG